MNKQRVEMSIEAASACEAGATGRSGPETLNLRSGDRVLLLGGYGVHNVGDEAILAGLLQTLPPDIRLSVVSRDPWETACMHGVNAVSPPAALRALLSTDVLIVGGGGIFSGHMGLMSRFIPVLGLLARVRRVRVVFHGLGVYPSTPRWVQQTIRWLAPHLTSFTVRDSVSAQTLRSWGIPVQQIPDLSNCMPPAPAKRSAEIVRSLGLQADAPAVALCLTAVEPGIEAPLLEAIPELVGALPQVQFCFVPMSQHPKVTRHNDLLLAHRIQTCVPQLPVLENFHHPSDILALFHRFDAAVCMRYHSLLFAHRAGAAIVPIPYAEKCESWVQEYGVTPAKPDAEALIQRVRQELARKTGSGEALELAP